MGDARSRTAADGPQRVEIAGAGGMVFDALAAGPAEGDMVLLLHGFPQSSATWAAQLEALAGAGYRAVAPDQRGYSPGARPTDVGEYRIGRLVDDVIGIADRVGAERFHLVGHDWGAVVAWHVAGRHPDRVRSLTTVSVPHPVAFAMALAAPDGDQRDRSGYISGFQQVGRAEKALLGGGLRTMLEVSGYPLDPAECLERMAGPGALTAALNWYRAMDADLVAVGPIAVPTLFVWSTGDVALGRGGAGATARYVEGPYRFEILEGVSHWIPEEAPDVLTGLLLDHLSSAQ